LTQDATTSPIKLPESPILHSKTQGKCPKPQKVGDSKNIIYTIEEINSENVIKSLES